MPNEARDDEDDFGIDVPSKREVDAALQNAVRVAEPFIKGLFLATAAAGAVAGGWRLAKRSFRKHFGT